MALPGPGGPPVAALPTAQQEGLVPLGEDPFTAVAYDATDAAVSFGLLPVDMPFETHVPEFGLLGYTDAPRSDVLAAGSASALPTHPKDLTMPTVTATLMLAGVGTLLIRVFVFGDLRRAAPRRR